MNVLFLLYNNFKSNSAIQVHNIANALTHHGVKVCVAVPKDKKTSLEHIGSKPLYTPLNFNELSKVSDIFVPDIMHCWTPRELVRKQCISLQSVFKKAKYVVHLEDNEELIIETNLQYPVKDLRRLSVDELDRIVPENLSHPIRYRQFLEGSQGVTIIIDALKEFVPKGVMSHVLWPILDLRFAEPVNDKMARLYRQSLGILDSDLTLAYVGNVHSANWKEVRSLYLAVALANREGLKVKLIRAGNDYYPFLGVSDDWGRSHSIELGLVPNHKIPMILYASDILVQPGKADKFNKYRLPSKIPEFLATGRPVGMPKTNVGKVLKNRKQAILFKKGDALEILNFIKEYSRKKDKFQAMAGAGKQFVLSEFSEEKIIPGLLQFYKEVIDEKTT